ncbi:hypothetical protein Ait01nite_077050 [Actinoplanes italicus]|nr:hypothetical protein Ait01nite_077050 [Actinoplanes italicus]
MPLGEGDEAVDGVAGADVAVAVAVADMAAALVGGVVAGVVMPAGAAWPSSRSTSGEQPVAASAVSRSAPVSRILLTPMDSFLSRGLDLVSGAMRGRPGRFGKRGSRIDN